jgi:hypothetical protein
LVLITVSLVLISVFSWSPLLRPDAVTAARLDVVSAK